jgi:hypothetical protein
VNKEEAKEDILLNRHNKNTSIYYLLLKKYIRKGNNSISDLNSSQYIEYINNPLSLLETNPDLKSKIYEEIGEK